jgi:alcohol dehydrogenase
VKIKAAVLDKMGLALPYAKSRPLTIEEIELESPGQAEVLVK